MARIESVEAGSTTTKTSIVTSALSILRFLATMPEPMGVNAIARELSIAPSSCFKILKQLQQAEFAEFDPRTKCYSLGSAATVLARRSLDPRHAFATLRSMFDQFGQTYGVAIGFWRRIPRGRIVLAGFLEGAELMRIHMTVGQRLPMFMGAVGRAFAADLNLSDDELRIEFDRLRWQGPLSSDLFSRQVKEARVLGYAVDHGNFAAGVTSVAVTIADPDSIARYGASAIMFSGQRDAAAIAELGEALVEISGRASAKLSGQVADR